MKVLHGAEPGCHRCDTQAGELSPATVPLPREPFLLCFIPHSIFLILFKSAVTATPTIIVETKINIKKFCCLNPDKP
jgi:hypothetical protein